MDSVTTSVVEAMICSESPCPEANIEDMEVVASASVESAKMEVVASVSVEAASAQVEAASAPVEAQPFDNKKQSKSRKKYRKKANSRMQIGDDNSSNQASDPAGHVSGEIGTERL